MRYVFLIVCILGFVAGPQAIHAQAPCAGLAPITGHDTVCAGNYVNLYDSTAGGTWSSSDTSKAIVNPATGLVTGILGGSTTITYATSPGCFVTKVIVVNALFPVIGDTSVCAGSTAFFSDLTIGGTWTSNNTSVVSINPASGVAYGVASGITVITYTLANGCHREKTVQVHGLPLNYYVFGGGIYCEGTGGVTIGLDGSDTGVCYKLYRNDTATNDSLFGSGGAIFFGSVTIPGSYTIVGMNVHTGCSKQMSNVAIVGTIPAVVPAVSIISSTGNDTVCIASAATYTAIPVNGGPTPSYHWFVNGASAGTGNTYSYVPNSGDVLYVLMTSTAVCALPGTGDASLLITTIPRVTPSVTLSVAPSDTVCLYTPVTFVTAPTYGGPSPTYRWMKNGITAAIAPSYSYMPANGDFIIAVLFSDYQCLLVDSIYSNPVNITVQPLLIPTVSIAAHPGTTIGIGQYDTLVTTVINGGTHINYQWQINSTIITGATTDTFISNTIADQDTVTCVVTSPEFCGGQPEIVSLVITDTLIPVVGVAGLQDGASVRIMPNPNNGTFSIYGTFPVSESQAEIVITNVVGQRVFYSVTPMQKGMLNTNLHLDDELANSVYIVRVSAGETSVVTRLAVSR